MTKRLLVLLLFSSCTFAQQSTQGNFLNWKTDALITAQAGVHIYAARLHNDVLNSELGICPQDGFCSAPAVDPYEGRFFNRNNRYSYFKEFGQMAAVDSLAYLLHRKGHAKWARAVIFADIGMAALAGYLSQKKYDQLDCRFSHFGC